MRAVVISGLKVAKIRAERALDLDQLANLLAQDDRLDQVPRAGFPGCIEKIESHRAIDLDLEWADALAECLGVERSEIETTDAKAAAKCERPVARLLLSLMRTAAEVVAAVAGVADFSPRVGGLQIGAR